MNTHTHTLFPESEQKENIGGFGKSQVLAWMANHSWLGPLWHLMENQNCNFSLVMDFTCGILFSVLAYNSKILEGKLLVQSFTSLFSKV